MGEVGFEETLLDLDLPEQHKQYFDFLELVTEDCPSQRRFEIREFNSKGIIERQFFPTKFELLNGEYCPPTHRNVNISMFSKRKFGDGSAENSLDTRIIWVDLDDGSNVDEVKNKINEFGLPPATMINNSGSKGSHGYWILKHRTKEKERVQKVVRKIAELFGADMKATSLDQVMRIPGTFHTKTDKSCKIVELNRENLYTLEDFEGVLFSEVNKELDEAFSGEQESVAANEGHVDKPNNPELISSERYCINSILKGVDEGERNFAQGRLIKYFQMIGKTKMETKKLIQDWNQRNAPPISEDKLFYDFEYYWRKEYKLLGCTIDSDLNLQRILDCHCDKSNCSVQAKIGQLKLDNAIKFNNRLFNKYEDVSGNQLIVLGILLRHPRGLNRKQLEEKIKNRATKKPCMTVKTMREALAKLEKMGLIESNTAYKKKGEKYLYRALNTNTFGKGYTIITNGVIHGAVDKRITPTELKTYILLLKYAYHQPTVWPSTITLAKEMGIDRTRVSAYLRNLEKSDYIIREYDENGKLKMKLLV